MSDSDAGPKVRDVCVIYRDKTNTDEWVGHALLTDQVVVGVSVLDAYIELRKALTNLALPDFAKLLANLPGALSQVSEDGTVAERAARLIQWAEAQGGPGLSEIGRVAADVLPHFR